MKITSSTSTRLALVMGLAIASSIISTVAKAESIPDLVNSHSSVSNKPFISNSARRDTLYNLNQRPLNSVLQTDGGKTKESSEKGKESSEKGKEGKDSKETCESGNCGGALIDRVNPVILPADQLKIPVLQNVRPQTLIKVNKPIF